MFLLLEFNVCLVEYLILDNLLILFGCCIGLCGICLVKVVGEIFFLEVEEREILVILVFDDV